MSHENIIALLSVVISAVVAIAGIIIAGYLYVWFRQGV